MKCPFCEFENPAYANFCMNCGAPQDLKACEQCGTINQKNATQCHGCGSGTLSKSPPSNHTSVAVAHSYAEEAEALAKETQTFKRLLTELEEEVKVKQQKSELKTSSLQEKTSLAAKAPLVSGRGMSPPPPHNPSMIVETPAYLQQLLSEREVQKKGNSGWRLLIFIALLLTACIVGYYGFA